MRIAIFSDNFYPELSGISDSILTTGRELARRGHEIAFFVPRYSNRDYKLVGATEKEIAPAERLRVVRLSPSFHAASGSGQGRAVIPLPWRWRAVKKFGPDVVHVQLFFGAGIEGVMASKKLKVPLVGTNHTAVREAMFLPYTPIHSKKIVGFLLEYIVWFYNKCDFVTTPSRSVFEDMAARGFKKEYHIVSNPIDTEIFWPLPEEEKKRLREKWNLGENTVVHAGRLAAERSIDVLVKAIASVKTKIPDIQLILVGKGPHENDLRRLAKNLGIGQNVSFLGFLDHTKLAEIYNGCKIFATASTTDTQSMVMMQAMACSLPVIAANTGGPAEYVNKNSGFLIEPGKISAFAEKINHSLQNSGELEKLGRGAQTSVKKLSAPEIAKTWEEIYETVIKKYSPRK